LLESELTAHQFFLVSVSHFCLFLHFSFHSARSNIFPQRQTNSVPSPGMLRSPLQLVKTKSPALDQITQPFLDNGIATHLPSPTGWGGSQSVLRRQQSKNPGEKGGNACYNRPLLCLWGTCGTTLAWSLL